LKRDGVERRGSRPRAQREGLTLIEELVDDLVAVRELRHARSVGRFDSPTIDLPHTAVCGGSLAFAADAPSITAASTTVMAIRFTGRLLTVAVHLTR
jgi:hypothetical protein